MQAMAILPELAVLLPGPGLAAVLDSVDLSAVPNDRMLDVLTAQQRQLCHEQARMAAILAELGRCSTPTVVGRVARLSAMDRYAPDETRAALRWTRSAAGFEHDVAETVVHAMPELFAAWLAGTVDRPRVLVFHRYLVDLAAEQVTAICRTAVPRAPKLTTGQLAVLLRRMVLAVDPAAAERWYRKGVRERNVVAVMDPDGTVTMSGNGLPADEAEAACVRLQDLADAAKRAGHPGLIGPRRNRRSRCDLFLGMLDGRFHGMGTEQVLATLIAQYRPDGPAATVAPQTAPAATDPKATATTATDTAPAATGLTATGPATAGPATAGPAGAGPAGAGPAGAGPAGAGSAIPRPTGAEPSASDRATTGPIHAGAPGAGPNDARVGIEVRVALSTLLGRDEHPGEIPGLGLLPAPDTRARVSRQRRAQWRFAVTDTTGRLLSEGITRHRPTTVGGHPVGRGGPTGGIVELHIPAALLDELVLGGTAVSGGWARVVADVTAQHQRRDRHLADLDAHPGRRFPHRRAAPPHRDPRPYLRVPGLPPPRPHQPERPHP